MAGNSESSDPLCNAREKVETSFQEIGNGDQCFNNEFHDPELSRNVSNGFSSVMNLDFMDQEDRLKSSENVVRQCHGRVERELPFWEILTEGTEDLLSGVKAEPAFEHLKVAQGEVDDDVLNVRRLLVTVGEQPQDWLVEKIFQPDFLLQLDKWSTKAIRIEHGNSEKVDMWKRKALQLKHIKFTFNGFKGKQNFIKDLKWCDGVITTLYGYVDILLDVKQIKPIVIVTNGQEAKNFNYLRILKKVDMGNYARICTIDGFLRTVASLKKTDFCKMSDKCRADIMEVYESILNDKQGIQHSPDVEIIGERWPKRILEEETEDEEDEDSSIVGNENVQFSSPWPWKYIIVGVLTTLCSVIYVLI